MALTYLNKRTNQTQIDFIPDHLNTIRDEIGWFIVEVGDFHGLTEPTIEIQTNVSIEVHYTCWPQTPLIEVFLYPNSTHLEMCIEVKVIIASGPQVASDSALLFVWNRTPSEVSEVLPMRDEFIDHLATNHSEFGINDTTVWTPIYNGAGILIVGHYLFRSDRWEMEVSWHNMIPPGDWVRVYLRQRSDAWPSWAGEIVSWSEVDRVVVEVAPPTEIYRAI
jgi:hypothetical protein